MPRPSTAARRYAEAAFEIAQRDDALDAWQRDLELAADVLGKDEARRVVDNPSVPLRERMDVVHGLLGKRVPDQVVRLVRLLAERGRVDLLPQIAGEYRRLLNAERGIVDATVTSATPLTDTEVAAIRERIAAMTSTRVELQTAVDDKLIGGLTVQVGDRLLDASVRGRIERLRSQLIAGGRLG